MALILILAVVLTSLFAACYKVAAHRRCNLPAVNLWFYIGSTASMGVYIVLKHRLDFNLPALLLGLTTGVCLFLATLSFFHHMKRGQLSASWTVISLSVGFPVLASILVWHEHPDPKQIVGMVLMVVALLLFGWHENTVGKGEI